jgi:hypothetical protein
MWFWPLNEMIELVSGMPTPQFGDESLLSLRIGAGSRFNRFLCFVLIDIKCLRVPLWVHVTRIEDNCNTLCLTWQDWKRETILFVERRCEVTTELFWKRETVLVVEGRWEVTTELFWLLEPLSTMYQEFQTSALALGEDVKLIWGV